MPMFRCLNTEHLCRNGEEIGNLTLVGGTEANVKDYICSDGCVCFRMTVEKTGVENFYKGKYYQEEKK